MKPLVTIIIPVYKVEEYLDRCVLSVVNQTYDNLQIILVDDGSPDNCGKICDKWKKKDSRIEVIHKKNGGLSEARNFGLRKSKGEYVLFVDSDDWISINMVEKMVTTMINDNADMVICDYFSFLPDGQIERKKPLYENKVFTVKEAIIETLEDKQITNHVWRKLYKRKLIPKDVFPVGKNYEDTYVSIDLYKPCKKIVHIREPLYYYYRNDLSITKTITYKNCKDRLDAYNYRYNCILEEYPELKDIANKYNEIVINNILTEMKLNKFIKSELFFKLKYNYKKKKKNFKRNIKKMRSRLGLVKKCLLTKGKKFYIFATPSYGNLGDQALLIGEDIFIQKYFKEYNIIHIPLLKIDSFVLHALNLIIRRKDYVSIQAGGNIGTLYSGIHNEQEKIIRILRRHKIVIFPQTFYYSNDKEGKVVLNNTKQLYSKCKNNLLICLREKESFDFVNKNFKDNKCLLVPDMAFNIDTYSKNVKRDKALLCLRRDLERTMTFENRAKLISILKKHFDTIEEGDTHIGYNLKNVESKPAVYELLDKMVSSKLVITDRLHGMIFASLTQTPCVILLSKSHKIKGCYEWIKHLDYICIVENIDDLEKSINKVMSVKKPKYDIKNLTKEFDNFAKELKKFND